MNVLLQTRFGGLIRRGSHDENGHCCILEYRSVKMGIPWTDDPILTRTWDIRLINDARWSSDALRTEWMIKLEEKVGGSLDWSNEKQKRIIERIVIETVKQIISELPYLPEKIRKQCREANSLETAKAAADAVARAAAAAVAADAAAAAAAAAADARAAAVARAAARAAATAAAVARAAARAAADKVLILTCEIWIGAVDAYDKEHQC